MAKPLSMEEVDTTEFEQPKRGRGRPKGSPNNSQPKGNITATEVSETIALIFTWIVHFLGGDQEWEGKEFNNVGKSLALVLNTAAPNFLVKIALFAVRQIMTVKQLLTRFKEARDNIKEKRKEKEAKEAASNGEYYDTTAREVASS